MNKYIGINSCIFLAIMTVSCASNNDPKFSPEKSFLSGKEEVNVNNAELVSKKQKELENSKKYRFVPPFKVDSSYADSAEDIINEFSELKNISFAADDLALENLLHLVFGEKLKVSYVIGENVKSDRKAVTLNLQSDVTERKLFLLTEELLNQRGYIIRFDSGVFYIHKREGAGNNSDVVYGYGKSNDDVPSTSLDIIQMVPFEFGLQVSLGNTLRQLIGIRATTDLQRQSLTIRGKRKDIIKALEFIRLMDTPTMKNRHVGVYQSVFTTTEELANKLEELLKQEGISVSSNGSTEKALSIVAIDKQGKLVLFANNQQIIERAVYWAEEIDKPLATNEKQYFLFHPNYARAVDIGESLQVLIGGNQTSSVTNSTSLVADDKANKSSSKNALSANSNDMQMVVDERANAVVFYTSGERYQQILPLIKRLDVLPKQVLLEVLIAEVTMTDEFKQGVEFAFANGNYGLSTAGAFMGEGGFGGLSYILEGTNGQVAINLLQTNSLVNVLSRPSIVVRDGVDASISVGTDIPIIGETTSDPINGEKQTTSIEYRQTGIELSVTPTVNSRGLVIMEIEQSISNELDTGSTVAGSPSVFERSIKTEVIAQTGQTVMLGGLISENKSNKQTKVPFFGDLPLLGALFRADTESGDKTELVVFVTPKVIDSVSDWEVIKRDFNNALEQLTIEKF
ncbi:general secretion pathway protein GspD [Thalassotalea sp. M1531]|uniref:General secretion pathway protein GspD n=1 Tax=Thalassotalea algicola TaxID=2716224 RepID=A0A7Y0LF19_9GAMM|nr:secretin N-terminal domain-containing protein [Thalassotalea algicola]NMP32952.1 general secretion pathway protein GspD [Thalassotalea algicola]